jgi:hypothetical protein
MELPDLDRLELMILGVYYRIRMQGRDRRSSEVGQVDPGTGLPLSEADLLPKYHALVGEELALKVVCDPEWWATCFTGLEHTRKDAWTDEDCYAHSEMKARIKRVVHRLAERGCMNERPPESGYDTEAGRLGDDGYGFMAKITPKGLDEAMVKIPSTKYKAGPMSALTDAPEAIRAGAPQYARDQWALENRSRG